MAVDLTEAPETGQGQYGVVYDPNAEQKPAPAGYKPFKTTTRDPQTGQVRVTAGFAPDAGPPTAVQAPGTGTDMTAGLRAAFASYPVAEAQKAIQAANQFIAQRGYQADLAKGTPAAAAFAKWGPMLIPSGSGMAQALNQTAPPPRMTPNELALQKDRADRLALAKQEFEARKAQSESNTAASLKKAQDALDMKQKQLDAVKEREDRLAEGTTTTETERDVPDSPEVQAQKAYIGPLGGKHPAVPYSPAVKAHKEKTIVRAPGNVNPTQGGQVAPATVKTIINKQTGERMQLIDGKWQPIQ